MGEGDPVSDVPAYRRVAIPLFGGRTAAQVFGEETLDLTKTLPFIAGFNAAYGTKLTLFRLLLHFVARTLHAHPRLNRFVSWGRLHQRREVVLSFAAKTAMDEAAPLRVVRRVFPKDEPLAAFLADLDRELSTARGPGERPLDKETRLFASLPLFLLRPIFAAARALSVRGLLPRAITRTDPFHASCFLANLGSVGGDAVFHHLYDYGTVGIFYCLGRVEDGFVVRDGAPAVAKTAKVRFAYDERVEDGFSAVRALATLHAALADPAAALGLPPPSEP